MTEPKDITAEELKDFLQSPGWRWFHSVYAQEWGDAGFGLKVAKSLQQSTEPAVIAETIRQWTAVKAMMDKLFSVPKQTLDMLRQAEDHRVAAAAPGRRPVGT